jgi:hypothetical protein
MQPRQTSPKTRSASADTFCAPSIPDSYQGCEIPHEQFERRFEACRDAPPIRPKRIAATGAF